MCEFKYFKNFLYFGIHVEAYTNQDNDIKKKTLMPFKKNLGEKYCNVSESFMNNLFDKESGSWIKPNGIAVITEKSNISTIDIDIPEECCIIDKLLKDCKFYVKTRKGYHFYFNRTDKLPNEPKLCKIADINTNLLFYVPEYTHNETGEVYKYELIKHKELVDMPKYAVDWCKRLIESCDKAKGKTASPKRSNVESIIINPSINIEKFDIESMKIIYKIFFEAKLFNTYEGWRDIGYMSRHLNNSEECFKLYDNYCRKVKGYEKEPENNNRKAFYGKGEYNENFDENGILIKCRKLNPKKFKEYLQHLYVSRYESEINYIDTEFIYQPSTTHIFDDWIKYFKVLALKSRYGSGKTYAFKKIMSKNLHKRVIFITYRQSLATSLILDLQENFGFDNYLDNNKLVNDNDVKLDIRKSDRLIIQLDSLQKIIKPYNFLLQKDGVPTFDLVVLDEIEGLLNHLSYNQINQYTTYNYLEKLVKRAPKVLALDGDMNDRSYDFLSSITSSYKFYVNKFKTAQKHFIFSHSMKSFDDNIKKDLKAKKKIVIVCMSKTASEKYYALYKSKYNVCIHNAIEKNKQKLMNVKEEWAKCDILIYSPTVESGVDFDVKNYFYKCYCILSNKSTSHRALNQMLNRVRHYENNEILCLLNEHMQWQEEDEIPYNYDEVRLTKYSGIEINNLVSVLIHNDTEKINSSNYFISSFLQLITSKGNTYTYLYDAEDDEDDEEASKSKGVSGATIVKKQIVSADDIAYNEYSVLLNKKMKNEDLSRDENNSFTKYLYSEVFALDNISSVNESFLKDHYNKLHVVKNVKAINLSADEREERKTKEYYTNFKFDKVDKIKELLLKVGFQISKNEIIKISNIEKDVVKTEIENFLLNLKIRTLFNLKKEHKVKYHLNDINNILENYGLELKDVGKVVRVGK